MPRKSDQLPRRKQTKCRDKTEESHIEVEALPPPPPPFKSQQQQNNHLASLGCLVDNLMWNTAPLTSPRLTFSVSLQKSWSEAIIDRKNTWKAATWVASPLHNGGDNPIKTEMHQHSWGQAPESGVQWKACWRLYSRRQLGCQGQRQALNFPYL